MEEKKECTQESLVNCDTPKKDCQKLKGLPLFVLGLGIGVVVLGAVSYGVTVKQVKNVSQLPLIVKSAEIFSVPMAKVNGKSILYTDYLADVSVLTNFYKKNPETQQISTEEVSNIVVDRLVALSLMQDIAKEFNIEVDEEEVESQKALIVDQFGGLEAAEKETQEVYGWSFDTYVEKVIAPFVLEQKIQEVISGKTELAGQYPLEQVRARHILFPLQEGAGDEVVIEKANEVLERIKGGEDFAALAQEFGSDGTAQNGGDLGWFGKGDMVSEFEEAAFGLEPGTVVDELVQTTFGVHILKVEEKRNATDVNKFMADRFLKAEKNILINITNPFLALEEATNTQG